MPFGLSSQQDSSLWLQFNEEKKQTFLLWFYSQTLHFCNSFNVRNQPYGSRIVQCLSTLPRLCSAWLLLLQEYLISKSRLRIGVIMFQLKHLSGHYRCSDSGAGRATWPEFNFKRIPDSSLARLQTVLRFCTTAATFLTLHTIKSEMIRMQSTAWSKHWVIPACGETPV